MQNENKDSLYAAFKSKDAGLDGRIFVGVSSTGIYCRPICKAKHPKLDNCNFYSSAAEAEKAGFRPCLLCRPELAPGNAPIDKTSNIAQKTARFLEENCVIIENISEPANRLGCSERHLRRRFSEEFNVSPIEYLQTCRLLLAKSLLTDTKLSIIDIAMASGFGSLRRFNDVFKKRYHFPPSSIRKEARISKIANDHITLSLGYRPPYRWDKILNFLAFRAIPGVEVVKNNEYLRTVHFVSEDKRNIYGVIRIKNQPQNNRLTITMNSELISVLPNVLTRVRHLFDLSCDPEMIYERLELMNKIKPGLCVIGARVPGCFNNFEMTVRAILGQQITVKAATTLSGRFVSAFGTPIKTGIDGLTHCFPMPETITNLPSPIEDHLSQHGIISSRAHTILGLAKAFTEGSIYFDFYTDPEIEINKLKSIKGIGNWTAQYIAMRVFRYTDAFPDTDYGVKKALAPMNTKEILALAESWRPWRAYATINLWNSL